MRDINSKFSVCPRCGKKLSKLKYTSMDASYYICLDGGCRTTIRDCVIDTMNIAEFTRLIDKLDIKKYKPNTFMLLKENLSGPMLKKVTNGPLERDKSMYCIVHAKNKEEAIDKFRKHFNVIKITEEMVIPISIKEE